MPSRILTHTQLDVYTRAFDASMAVFKATKSFPRDELYSLTDQIRRSSRSVAACITEAWRKRRYEAAFVSKLNDAEAEAAETQTWLQYAVECGYLDKVAGRAMYKQYDAILASLVGMITHADKWTLPMTAKQARENTKPAPAA